MELHELTLTSFSACLRKKKFSAREIAEEYLNAIKKNDGDICAFHSTFGKDALETADSVDEDLKRGEKLHLLAGASIAIKDNILVEGTLATAASKILGTHTARYDATVVQKLKSARAVILGKTNMDEFAMGSSTENSAFQVTKNPSDISRVPGGSSGGSAAAVAGGMALAALGSDTGGSVRQPASFCGVVGLKPTYGAVSRFGLIAMASSLDQIGPFAKTVEDAALIFDVIRGKDEHDSTSVDFDFAIQKFEKSSRSNLTIGVPKEYFVGGLDSRVEQEMDRVRKFFENEGFKVKEVSLPHTHYALSAYYIIMPAEVSTNLARFDGIRYARVPEVAKTAHSLKRLYFEDRGAGFGKEARRRILLGTFVLSAGYHDAYYAKAQKVRRLVREDFDRAFDPSADGVDVLLTPTAPTQAFKIGEKTEDPISMYLSDIFTVPVNLAGVPAISIPTEKYSLSGNSRKLPVGFQLIGKHFHEADILSLGMYYEKHI